MGDYIPEASQAARDAHRAAHPELFGRPTATESLEQGLAQKTSALRQLAKGRLLTYAHDQGIIDTIAEDYQLELAPDLERTARVAESMGLVVNIIFEPATE